MHGAFSAIAETIVFFLLLIYCSGALIIIIDIQCFVLFTLIACFLSTRYLFWILLINGTEIVVSFYIVHCEVSIKHKGCASCCLANSVSALKGKSAGCWGWHYSDALQSGLFCRQFMDTYRATISFFYRDHSLAFKFSDYSYCVKHVFSLLQQQICWYFRWVTASKNYLFQ